MKLFCFGYGYVARHFAELECWESIYGTHRNTFPLDEKGRRHLAEATHILVSIPPDAAGDIIMRESYEMKPEWVGYLSTTGVYGNTNGEWVDEDSVLDPITERSKMRVMAEIQWLSSGLPVNIYRLSGIYGPGRSAIDELHEGTARRIFKENQFFSRIHVADIVQILEKSLSHVGTTFNCADDLPAPATEVVEYAAKLMGVEPPPLVRFEDADLSEMARSFYSASRKVKNTRIKEMLGIELKFPTYKEGLTDIFTNYKPI